MNPLKAEHMSDIVAELGPAVKAAFKDCPPGSVPDTAVRNALETLRTEVSPHEWLDPFVVQENVDRFVCTYETPAWWLRRFAVHYRAALLAKGVHPTNGPAQAVLEIIGWSFKSPVCRVPEREVDKMVAGVYQEYVYPESISFVNRAASLTVSAVNAVYQLLRFTIKVVSFKKLNLPGGGLDKIAQELVEEPVSAYEFLQKNPLHAYLYLVVYHAS